MPLRPSRQKPTASKPFKFLTHHLHSRYVDLKDELASTGILISCYDRTGKEVKRVTSTSGEMEDPENENQGGEKQNGGNNNQGGGNTPGDDDSPIDDD